jgi:hypothetical protein
MSALVGCADTASAFLQTIKQAIRPDASSADSFQTDARYRYLRVTHQGGVSIVVLGALENNSSGQVEVYYSADGGTLRLQNGRLAGNTDLLPEWRSVRLPELPSWPDLAAEGKPVQWERVRDVMPGYRFGIHDKLLLSRVPAPRSTGLVGVDAQQLVWFEERTEASSDERLPIARYATRGNTVVYAEQCVSVTNCLKWQRWPAGS